MAKYRMQQMPDLKGEGKQVTYPKMVVTRRIDLKHIARDIAFASGFTPGEVEGLAAELSAAIGRYTAAGYSVKLNGIGTFTATLALKEGFTREEEGKTKRNATSIQISNIAFRPDKELLQHANTHCHLTRDNTPQYTNPGQGREQRLQQAINYINTNGAITAKAYATLTRLAYSTAYRELQQFCKEQQLTIKGPPKHTHYILPTTQP